MDEESRWNVNLELVSGNTNLVAIGEAILNERYVLSPVKVVKNTKEDKDKNPWIYVLPNIRRIKNGETVWESVFEFTSQKTRKEFEAAMFEGVRDALMRTRGAEPYYDDCNLKIEVEPVESKYTHVKGIATIQYEDVLRIKNVCVTEGKNGLFISYPSTYIPPDKEKGETLAAMSQIKERIKKISGDGGMGENARKELDSLIQYIETKENKLSKGNYEAVIKPEGYFFSSHVEDAVIKEYTKCTNAKQKDNNLEEKKKSVSR